MPFITGFSVNAITFLTIFCALQILLSTSFVLEWSVRNPSKSSVTCLRGQLGSNFLSSHLTVSLIDNQFGSLM